MDWLRDLAVVILGFTGAAVLIFLAVLAWFIYREVKTASDSVRDASRTVRDTVQKAGDEGIKPIFQIIALIQGVRQGVDEAMKLFRRRREGQGGN
jgi:hypothetical protein